MREVQLLLHRKIARQDKCMCGSKMIMINDWICLRQYKERQPNKIDLVEKKR